MNPLLSMDDVSLSFKAKRVLCHLSFEVERGECFGFLGPSGAGKTTTIKLLTRQLVKDSGRIMLFGRAIEHATNSDYERIGILSDTSALYERMTIEENLALAYLRTAKHQRAFFSRVSKADKAFFREQLARLDMGLEDRMRQPVGLLSGGQRQALTLLMATMVPPKLLLLDEHTAALDPATAEKVLRLTREIVEGERITCLMITHNMKNALELGSRTFMMDAGRVVLDIGGEERKGLTVDDLLERFRAGAGKNLDNDRILLSND